MSKEFPTVNETIAYDDGFADAKDYWTAKEQERIIKRLEASAMAWSDDCAVPVDWKHCQNCWQIGSLIASIKGNNK